jgi:hypothetical protein
MNFFNRLILMITVLLAFSLTAHASQKSCSLDPPANSYRCFDPIEGAEAPKTLCLVYIPDDGRGIACVELWYHTDDQCEWNLVVPRVCEDTKRHE